MEIWMGDEKHLMLLICNAWWWFLNIFSHISNKFHPSKREKRCSCSFFFFPCVFLVRKMIWKYEAMTIDFHKITMAEIQSQYLVWYIVHTFVGRYLRHSYFSILLHVRSTCPWSRSIIVLFIRMNEPNFPKIKIKLSIFFWGKSENSITHSSYLDN